VNAQQVDTKHDASDTIVLGNRLNKYYLKGLQVGFNDIQPLLVKYPSSTTEYFTYRKQNAASTTILILADVAAVIAIFKSQSFSASAPFIGGFIGGLAVGIPLSTSAKKHFRKSVLNYNQEILR
jgi:hypothetical protein